MVDLAFGAGQGHSSRNSRHLEAGVATVHSELFAWHVPFPDETSLWALATGPAMLGAVIGELAPARPTQARSAFLDLLADYRRPDDSYAVPCACRMLWGSR